MAMPQRVGRAVLELNVDKAQYSSGLTEATKEQQAFGATVQRTYRDMVQGMNAAARQQSESVRMMTGMAQEGRRAAMELQKTQTLSAQVARGMSGNGFTAGIQAQRKELDALARGMTVAGKEATASSRMIAGMGVSGKLAADGLKTATTQTTLAQRASTFFTSSLIPQFTAANLAASGIQFLTSRITEFISTGTKLPAVESTFRRLNTGINQDADQMLRGMTDATHGLVANYDLMTTANKAILLGLPVTSKSMAELARTATTLGRAMGKDATSSIDDLITALGRSSPMILDNLGLTVKVGEANEAYAAKLGKTADALTQAEQKTAFYEAAMAAARAKTKELGDATLTGGEQIIGVWTRIGNVVSASTAQMDVGLGAATRSWKAFRTFLDESVHLGPGVALSFAAVRADAERLAKLGKEWGPWNLAQKGDIDVGRAKPLVPPNYTAELQRARIEVGKLTTAQRAEVLAAQQMGKGDEVVAATLKRYGVEAVSVQLALAILSEKTKTVTEKVVENATKYGSLTSALVATQLQIANLEGWQRKDIDAGIALGASTDDIAKKMGLAKEVVAGYADQVKASSERTADLEKNLRELVKAANDAANLKGLTIGARVLQDATAANLAQRGTGDTFRRIALQRAEFEAEAAENAGASWQQVFVLQQRVGRMRLEEDKRLAAREFAIATTGLDQTSDVYEQMAAEHNAKIQEMTEAFEQGEVLKRDALKRTHDVWRQRWAAIRSEIVGGTSDAVGEMLVGLRGFKDGFLDIWTSIRRSVANVLSGMVNDFLTGYLKRLTGSAVAGLVPGLGAGAGGGLLGTAANVGGSAALGGLLGGGGASLGLGTLTLDGSVAAAGGTAAAGGGAAAAGGLGSTIAGLATNPFTIAAAAALGGFVLWKKFGKSEESKEVSPRRAQFWAQAGGFAAMGSKLTQALIKRGVPDAGNKASGMLAAVDAAKQLTTFRAAEDPIVSAFRLAGITNVKKFNMGGFVPPGITQPAILHGGRRGEYVIPGDKLERSAPAPVSINKFEFTIHAMDGADVTRVFESQILPRIKKAVRHNQDGLVTEMRMRVPKGAVR